MIQYISDPTPDTPDSCFVSGSAIGGTKVDVGVASSNLYCKHNVEVFQPTANGATFAERTSFTERYRKCYAVIGMTGVNSGEKGWLTCPFDQDPVPGSLIKQKSRYKSNAMNIIFHGHITYVLTILFVLLRI